MNLDMERQIREIAAVCRLRAGAAEVAEAALAVVRRVERLVSRARAETFTDGKRAFAPKLLEEVYNLEDALLVGGFLNTLLRQSDRVRVACLAQILNVIAPLVTNETSVLRQSTYYPYAWALQYARGTRPGPVRRIRDLSDHGSRTASGCRARRSGAVRRRRRHTRSAERPRLRADAQPRPRVGARAGARLA